jgi:lipid-binding SYLF domain-containing protein
MNGRLHVRNVSWALAILLAVGPARAGDDKKESDEADRLRRAAAVLEAAVAAEDASIPEALLRKAWGIAVVPHVVKGAFGIGGRHGKGVVARRSEEGEWSAPAFVSLGGASFGLQFGVEATDLILVFTEREGLDALLEDRLKLGAEAGLTAGPLGRKAEAGTNLTLDSAIYSYSRSKGLFAGVSLDGAVLRVDRDANTRVYGLELSAEQILSGEAGAVDAVQPFREALAKHVPPREA